MFLYYLLYILPVISQTVSGLTAGGISEIKSFYRVNRSPVVKQKSDYIIIITVVYSRIKVFEFTNDINGVSSET